MINSGVFGHIICILLFYYDTLLTVSLLRSWPELSRHHVIQPLRVGSDNLGLPTDEEEEELGLIESEE